MRRLAQAAMIADETPSALAAAPVGAADVKPASEGELGPGGLTGLIGNAPERALYEIEPKGDGRALIRALCPGADRVFLAFGPITAEQPLRIHALGHDIEPQLPAERCAGSDDLAGVAGCQGFAHEGLVDLHLVERHAHQRQQAGMAGAEVVDREIDAARSR